ncbi:MAG: NYN domain-containing protein [Gammaproteobacteria bacterium]|nr:NYN domain-containing protein [Gammaproteobacteria bacterium]
MSLNLPLLRAYYYHCLPYQTKSPTTEENKKFSHAQKFFKALSRLDNFTVKTGKLEFRGVSERAGRRESVFVQKRVDVLLATDLVMHSTKRLISHAVLVTGDSDFIPAIEITKSEGVNVVLFSSERNECRAHDELLDMVDVRKAIDGDMFRKLRRE